MALAEHPPVERYVGPPLVIKVSLLDQILDFHSIQIQSHDKDIFAGDILFLDKGIDLSIDPEILNQRGVLKTYEKIKRQLGIDNHKEIDRLELIRNDLSNFLHENDNLSWFIGFLSHAQVRRLAETARETTRGFNYKIDFINEQNHIEPYDWSGDETGEEKGYVKLNLFGTNVRVDLLAYEAKYPPHFEQDQQLTSSPPLSRYDYNESNSRNGSNGHSKENSRKRKERLNKEKTLPSWIVYQGPNEPPDEDLDYIAAKERTVTLSLQILGILPFPNIQEIEAYIHQPESIVILPGVIEV